MGHQSRRRCYSTGGVVAFVISIYGVVGVIEGGFETTVPAESTLYVLLLPVAGSVAIVGEESGREFDRRRSLSSQPRNRYFPTTAPTKTRNSSSLAAVASSMFCGLDKA